MASMMKSEGPLLDGDEAEGAIVGESIHSFVKGIPLQIKKDILNSVLLAQLSANSEHNRFTEQELWYQKYVEVLENIGWIVENFKFEEYKTHGTDLTIDQAVIDIAKSMCTDDEIDIATKALSALKTDDDAFAVWSQSASNSKMGNFKLSPAKIEVDNKLVESAKNEDYKLPMMTVSAFKIDAQELSTRFLWAKWSETDVRIWKAVQRMDLDEEAYADIREEVKAKLGDLQKVYIRSLKI